MLPHSGPHNGKSGVSLNTITAAWHLAARLKYQRHYINYYKKYMSPLAGLQNICLYGRFLYSYCRSRERTEVLTHLDGRESVVPARGGVSALARLVWTYANAAIALRCGTKQTKPRSQRGKEAVLARFHSNPGAVRLQGEHNRPSN